MIGNIDRKVARAGRKAALGTGALVALSVGTAFLTLAAWIVLVEVADTLTAAVVIGSAYVGLGFILLAFAKGSGSHNDAHHHAATAAPAQSPPGEAPPLMAAFLHGMNAGAQSASKPKH